MRCSAGVLGGRAAVRPFLIAIMFDQMFKPDAAGAGGRSRCAGRAGFSRMAALNEIIWRTQSTDFWVNFKVFGMCR